MIYSPPGNLHSFLNQKTSFFSFEFKFLTTLSWEVLIIWCQERTGRMTYILLPVAVLMSLPLDLLRVFFFLMKFHLKVQTCYFWKRLNFHARLQHLAQATVLEHPPFFSQEQLILPCRHWTPNGHYLWRDLKTTGWLPWTLSHHIDLVSGLIFVLRLP